MSPVQSHNFKNETLSSSSSIPTKGVHYPGQTDDCLTADTVHEDPSTLTNRTSVPESTVFESVRPPMSANPNVNSYTSELAGNVSNEKISDAEEEETKEVDVATQDLLTFFDQPREERRIQRVLRDSLEYERVVYKGDGDFTHDFTRDFTHQVSVVIDEKGPYLTTTQRGEQAAERRGRTVTNWEARWSPK
ncbi:hypothetical protein M231_07881 [Tremella mesenterica]|uniref:Uncharacterized protein n=1 Tax=Tremella mesenterica TaxID=5217 RepID=A0A4Q1BFK6_TREME|nr:hypothetical protein M231_07881 [Tremella mesenterica]